ncbi:MAG: hypothetical protein L0322_00110 [Chloroflexi bacterium]|nr:hypothetical protein [Chloroflexota bacterium]
MEDTARRDIRRLLKTFGIQADEALTAHLERHPQMGALQVRIVLEDLTEYGDSPPAEPLRVEVEDTIVQRLEIGD